MRIGTGNFEYDWIADWAEIPNSDAAKSGWAHHGMAVTNKGEVIAIHPSDATVLIFDTNGKIIRSFPLPIREGHQLALSTKTNGKQSLWVADPGRKNIKPSYDPVLGGWGGQVLNVSLTGQIHKKFTAPPHDAYKNGTFSPTSMTIFESSKGGNDDIWITDGYGESYIHRYSKDGDYIDSISGEEGLTGRFDCPHGVWVDYRHSEPELNVADRTNHRVQVYDLEGVYKRAFGTEVLTSPSAFAIDGQYLIVAELRARLAVFDIDDNFVTYIGENKKISRIGRNSEEDIPGWPNNIGAEGNPARSGNLEIGKFNSPHGIATDRAGNIYSGEWLIGGRYTKLSKVKD